MIQLTESYTWQQSAAKSKLSNIDAALDMVSFTIDGIISDVYLLSQFAAVEGLKIFGQKIEENWLAKKDDLLAKYPKFNFEKRFRINIFNEPTGELISFEKFVGFDFQNQPVNIKDYQGCALAYALLEPPYGIRVEIDAKYGTSEYHIIKTKKYTSLYKMFLNNFVMLSEYSKEDFIIYSWSDDWSNYFDAGKEWWGTFYWTVFNKKITQ